MGVNMQCQVVLILCVQKLLVGIGIECVVVCDLGVIVNVCCGGEIVQIDVGCIVVKVNELEIIDVIDVGVDIYNLIKYICFNQNICINQCLLVEVGNVVVCGDVLVDGLFIDIGELVLGQNMLIVFMLWNGYNFEDFILFFECVVEEDCYIMIYIEELICVVCDIKLGLEEIFVDILNVFEQVLNCFDELGVVYIGVEVCVGDIMVGKVMLKGESQLILEEKLLCVIFGEKVFDVKDSLLCVLLGMDGIVIDVQVFICDGIEKDKCVCQIEENEIKCVKKDFDDQFCILEGVIYVCLCLQIVGKVVNGGVGLKKGDSVIDVYLDGLKKVDWFVLCMKDEDVFEVIECVQKQIQVYEKEFECCFVDKCGKIIVGDDLVLGVLKMVKVFLVVKCCIQLGDKMVGCYGNKGVVFNVVLVEDMLYMVLGEIVDIVLNLLGVLFCMNIGQILEVYLGWVVKGLGCKIQGMFEVQVVIIQLCSFLDDIYNYDKIQVVNYVDLLQFSDEELLCLVNNLIDGVLMVILVFDGVIEVEIKCMFEFVDLLLSGQIQLYDGCIGEVFDCYIIVGYMYYLKLNYLVDDKMYVCLIGLYLFVIQQLLGGKVQFGGQCFGEMEVWVLEVYGVVYILQEMLMVKFDDVQG